MSRSNPLRSNHTRSKSSKVGPSKINILEALTYEQFQLEILGELENILGENYVIELNQVIKNNSVELVAIIIKEEENYLSPNIYLESYYDLYIEGHQTKEIVELIVDSHFEHLDKGMNDIRFFEYNWDNIKDGVFYRIINREKNLKLLHNVPHLLYLDLAITFHYLVTDTNQGIGIIRITKDHIKEWGIKLKELRDTAIANTPRLFPANIRNMNDVILDILNKDWLKSEDNYDVCDPGVNWQDDLLVDLVMTTEKEGNPMYVLSNSRGISGATCLLYKEVLYKFAHELDSDLYILPSSIHELIIVKDDGYIDKEDLLDMVVGVNEMDVEEEDFLSNQVYHYNRFKNMVTM